MEIKFLHEKFTEKDPKLLMNHIQRMASGEAPFFPTTLSLVYGKLVQNAFAKYAPFGFGPGNCTGSQSFIHPSPHPQASTSTSNVPSSSIVDLAASSSTVELTASSSDLQAPASVHGPVLTTTPTSLTRLKCVRCGGLTRLQDLYEGLRCPLCPATGKKGRRPFMRCASCNTMRTARRDDCCKKKCGGRFM